MKILGVDLIRDPPADRPTRHTLVILDDDGRVARHQRLGTLPEVAAAVGQLAGDDAFLLGVDIPVVVPAKPSRMRPLENHVRRRFGTRLGPGGRAALSTEPLGVAGEALMAGLAAAGRPCVPYPDRDRRQSGLAEIHPALVLKALLWEGDSIAGTRDQQGREALLRAYAAPAYRAARLPARTNWAEQAVALDLLLRLIGPAREFDIQPVRERLARAGNEEEVESAAALLDAVLIASTAHRYLQSPESCLFVGDREGGYCILPADGFIRRMGSTEAPTRHGELFPQASLRELLGRDARLRSMDLLSERVEATFESRPRYEFDNRDEMMWWKHCRHVAGPRLPIEGLAELTVVLESKSGDESPSLRLVRSRHNTPSFRFDSPAAWRRHVPTRDNKTYPLRVLRAVYETLPADE